MLSLRAFVFIAPTKLYSFASAVISGLPVRLSVRLSVRPSVRQTPVLCQNEGTQRDAVLPSGTPVSLVFWHQEWLMGDHRCPGFCIQDRVDNILDIQGPDIILRLSEAPLRPEARGICHSCHMDNPALLR